MYHNNRCKRLFHTLNIAETEKAVVNFEKEGYLLGSTLIQVDHYTEGTTSVSSNYLEYAIDTYDHQWSYDAQTVASGSNINIPANVYTDTAGDSYSGEVTTELEILDVASQEGKTLFPGAFEGENINGDTVQFESYGLISLVPKDASGNTLNFTDSSTVALTFDAVASLDEQIVPMWYYDNAQNTWIEEGYAQRQEDGTYRGEISHPGTWRLLLASIAAVSSMRMAHLLKMLGSMLSEITGPAAISLLMKMVYLRSKWYQVAVFS